MHELLKTYLKPLIILFITLIIILGLLLIFRHSDGNRVMGGILHSVTIGEEDTVRAAAHFGEAAFDAVRFQRPSSQPAINIRYPFKDIQNDYETVPVFQNPEDLIAAYYGILREASNMRGYRGGCGAIGNEKLPYSYAYRLMSPASREATPLRRFVQSFEGTGHTSLLELLPAYMPDGTPDSIRYYMVEIETVTGPKTGGANGNKPQPSYFAYYYGLIAVEHTGPEGWKISKIDYIPEDFLCAPYHGWCWEASAVVETVYQSWYKLIDRIERIETRGDTHSIYASGNGTSYRFDFVQLANGTQVLLHENVKFAGQWKETNLLNDKDEVYKLSVLNPNLK